MDLNVRKKLSNGVTIAIIIFTSQNLAASVTEAVTASKNNESIKAVKLWAELANTGNSIAQFNLASYYSNGDGVKKNKNSADKWLKNATRSGLIQAYLNLNKKAVAPAKGLQLDFNINPELWLHNQTPSQYTIQLASSRNINSIKKSYNVFKLEGKGGYFHYVRNGVDRYGLVYGTYKSVAEANLAMKKLPEVLREKTPWVRKISSIQNISEQVNN